MYVDLAFINCAELTAAVMGESCFSCGKDKMLVATVAALHVLGHMKLGAGEARCLRAWGRNEDAKPLAKWSLQWEKMCKSVREGD